MSTFIVYIQWFEFTGNNAKLYSNNLGFQNEKPIIECLNPDEVYSEIFNFFSLLDKDIKIGYYSGLSFFYKILDLCIEKKSSTPYNLTEQIKSYIQCHFHNQEFTVKDICHHFSISHSTLCNYFRANGKLGVKELILTYRIEYAKMLLKETNLYISEVALSCGFSDNIHFMKSFHSRTGMTATEYRKLYKK